MRIDRYTLGVSLLVLVAACNGVEEPLALGEPLFVQQGTFKHGELPGTDPVDGAPSVKPAVTSFATSFGVLRPGAHGGSVSGRTSDDAYSVGLRFADQGSGYWVQSVGSVDPQFPGELNWSVAVDAATDIEPGLHDLEIVAFDKDGHAGTRQATKVCIASELPDNQNVCNPKNKPPLVIASLSWDQDADLDLSVVAPDGTTFGRSKRSLLEGTSVIARLDNDGVSGCLADGRRMENFLWNEGAASGYWHVYANLFDSCGKAGIGFTLTLYQRQDNADGTYTLVKGRSVEGEFVRQQANGGAGAPLFLTDVVFQ